MRTVAIPIVGAALAFGGSRSGAAQQPTDSITALVPRIDSVFAQYDRTHSVGCALGVVRNGRLIYERGYGMADLERGVAMTTQTVVDIGSVSKQFTALAVMMLADRKQISLDDDIRKYVPELPRYARPITIRQLIHHTSGLRDYITLFLMAGLDLSDVTTDDDALAMLARQRELNFPPGEQYSYSNSGYFLLTLVIKRVTGKSFREFAKGELFEPLGMSHTRVHDFASLVPNRAVGYSRKPNGELEVEIWRFTQTGDGAVFSTIQDLLFWDTNFYTSQVGGPAVMAEMHRTAVLNDGKSITYAGGNNVSRFRGLRRVSHTGGGGGFSSAIIRFPDQQFSVLVSCNQDSANAGGKAQAVADLYLARDFTEPPDRSPMVEGARANVARTPAPLTPAQLAGYAGEYRSDELDTHYRIDMVGDHLQLRTRAWRAPYPLKPLAVDSLVADNFTLRFSRNRDSRVTGFVLDAGRIHDLRFERLP